MAGFLFYSNTMRIAEKSIAKIAERGNSVRKHTKRGHLYGFGTTWFLAIDQSDINQYGSVEYVHLKAGFMLYNSSADSTAYREDYFPLQNTAGEYAYLANDMYLTWTKQSESESYGVVAKPIKDFIVSVAAGTTIECFPEESLTAEKLYGVIYTSSWVDPNETAAALSGNVTPAMCSKVAQDGTVTVSLNGKTTTFNVTVLEVSMPVSIEVVAKDALSAYSITYQKYAIVPEINNCQVKVTYADDTSENFDLTADMITSRINTIDNTSGGVLPLPLPVTV